MFHVLRFNGRRPSDKISLDISHIRTLGVLDYTYVKVIALFWINFCYDLWMKNMQMRGKKQVILIDPHSNHQLYEGHIQEATMSYNFSSHSFERKHLLDETVYVWTPFDISNPDYSVSLSLHIDNSFMRYFNFKNEWNAYKLSWLLSELKRLFYRMWI